jgi:hypothetical protein
MVWEVAISRAISTVRLLVITSVRALVTAESALVVVTCITVHGVRVVTREQLACVRRDHESRCGADWCMIRIDCHNFPPRQRALLLLPSAPPA